MSKRKFNNIINQNEIITNLKPQLKFLFGDVVYDLILYDLQKIILQYLLPDKITTYYKLSDQLFFQVPPMFYQKKCHSH